MANKVVATGILLLFAALSGSVPARGQATERWERTFPTSGTTRSTADLFSNGAAYVVAEAQLFRSTDGGTTWTPIILPNDSRFVSQASFASPDLGYVYSGREIHRTEDGGASWANLPGPDAPNGRFLIDALEAGPQSDLLTVTTWGFDDSSECNELREQAIWTSSDAGDTWSAYDLPWPAFARELEFLDKRNGLLLTHRMSWEAREGCSGVMRADASFVLLTRDGGKTFKIIHTAYFEDQDPVISVGFAGPRTILIGTEGGQILRRKGGSDFLPVLRLDTAPFAEAARVDAIHFGTRSVGYAGLDGTGIWRTTDGGRTWSQEPSPYETGYPVTEFGGRSSIAAAGPHEAIAIGPGAIARRIP